MEAMNKTPVDSCTATFSLLLLVFMCATSCGIFQGVRHVWCRQLALLSLLVICIPTLPSLGAQRPITLVFTLGSLLATTWGTLHVARRIEHEERACFAHMGVQPGGHVVG